MTDTQSTSQTAPDTADAPATPEALGAGTGAGGKLVLCPYCGANQRGGERCGTCGGLFEPLSQKATQIAMGPWYLRDRTNPFRPGCSYEVLSQMVKSGRIKPTTVVRGPTTRQFWSVARNVEGIAHLLGYCHSCHAHVRPTDASCESCGAGFKAIESRDELGLRYRTKAEVLKAREELQSEIDEAVTGTPRRKPRSRPPTAKLAVGSKPGRSADLLDDGLDADGKPTARAGHDGQTLDFSPSDKADGSGTGLSTFDESGDGGSAAAVGGGISGTTIALSVLIALNILSMGGLALLYVWTQRG